MSTFLFDAKRRAVFTKFVFSIKPRKLIALLWGEHNFVCTIVQGHSKTGYTCSDTYISPFTLHSRVCGQKGELLSVKLFRTRMCGIKRKVKLRKGAWMRWEKPSPTKKVVLLHILMKGGETHIEGIMTKRHPKDTQIYPKVNLSPKLESKAIHTMIKNDYPQDCPPQDCPLGGNPESISHQDCPP